jgi:hypothetical protein
MPRFESQPDVRSIAQRAKSLSAQIVDLLLELQSLKLRDPHSETLRETAQRLSELADELSRLGDAIEAVGSASTLMLQEMSRPRSAESAEASLPPRKRSTSTREFWWATFIGTSDVSQIQEFLSTLRLVWVQSGLLDIVDEESPIRGSFFQRIKLRFRSSRAAHRMVDTIVAAYVELPQATADKMAAEAVAALVAQAKDPALGDVVLQARDTVLIKLNPTDGGVPVLVARQLTPAQRRRLESNPAWLLDPRSLFARLTVAGEIEPAP